MCGIAGMFCADGRVESSAVERLTTRLGHRGPDRVQIHVDGAMGMGHARLSIIDLAGGNQPMIAEDGNLVLVANGEIYNFVELRQELEGKGALFSSHSDCEVILHAYRHYGSGFISRLHGMFAFALYDKAQGELWLARDRLGIKPLFFTESAAGFSFASEQKALFALLDRGLTVRPEALVQSLETGFNTGAHTLVAGIERVQPGELVLCKAGRVHSRSRYWLPHPGPTLAGSFADAAATYEDLMAQVMLEHRRADVPFALFLSGGVDSSVVLEWLRRGQSTHGLAAFTVAFADAPQHDDLDAAKAIARRFELRHHVLELDGKTLFQHLPYAVWAADDFIVDHAILPTSLLAREVAREFKVVFSGEGGDELFAGYGRYRRSHWQRRLANWLAPGSGGFRTRGQLGAEWRKKLLQPALRDALPSGRLGFQQAWSAAPGEWSDLQKMQYTDLRTELPDQLLIKLDRLLMAWGLEGRVPLLDHRLVEFALGLPDELKVQGRQGKEFLKRWAEPIYGAEFVRRPKRGFSVPVGACLAGDTLRRLGQTLPRHRAFDGLFAPAGLVELIKRQQLKGDVSDILWSLLQFAVWQRIFIENRGEKPDFLIDPVDFLAST